MKRQKIPSLGWFLVVVIPFWMALACNFQLGGTPPSSLGTPTWQMAFIAPSNNAVIAVGTEITLAVAVQETTLGVSRVEFFVDGVALATQTAPIAEGQTEFTAQQSWTPLEARGYLLTAAAYSANGNKIGEAGVTVQAVKVEGLSAIPTTASTPTGAATLSTVTVTSSPRSTSDSPQSASTQNSGAPTPTVLMILSSAQPLISATPNGLGLGQPTATQTTIFIPPAETTVAPQPTPPPTNAPSLRVTFDFLNVRAAPSANSAQIGRLEKGETVTIIARNEDRTWWVIEKDALRGWVINNSAWIQVTGDTINVPLGITVPTATPAPTQPPAGLAPTSTIAGSADLIFEQVQIQGQPKANETFQVLITVKNQGTVDAGSALIEGVFQPNGERSQLAVPPLKANQSITLPPMFVTLRSAGTNLSAVITLDAKSEVAEGTNGEANNTRTITYNVQ